MNNFLCEIQDHTIIRVSGEDKAKFLHSQLTVDAEKFDSEYAKITAHCDFKGKMWSIGLLVKDQQDFYLICQSDGALKTLEQLNKYGVFSKVDISAAEEMSLVAGAGPDCIEKLSSFFPQLPDQHLGVAENNGQLAICFAQSEKRYLCLLSSQTLNDLTSSAKELVTEQSQHEWLEVTDGYGNIQAQSISEYVPQMFNLQYINAIDFEKGCYMGQEVVARTKFLGKNKRALYLLEAIDDNPALTIGDIIERKLGDSWRRAGNVIRFATWQQNTRTLAVLPNDITENDQLRTKTQESHFKVIPLPYDVE